MTSPEHPDTDDSTTPIVVVSVAPVHSTASERRLLAVAQDLRCVVAVEQAPAIRGRTTIAIAFRSGTDPVAELLEALEGRVLHVRSDGESVAVTLRPAATACQPAPPG